MTSTHQGTHRTKVHTIPTIIKKNQQDSTLNSMDISEPMVKEY